MFCHSWADLFLAVQGLDVFLTGAASTGQLEEESKGAPLPRQDEQAAKALNSNSLCALMPENPSMGVLIIYVTP